LPKPKTANPKVVQMRIIMWFATIWLPISFLAPCEVKLCGIVTLMLSASSLLLRFVLYKIQRSTQSAVVITRAERDNY